jgi:predicted neuraminidase
MLSGQIFSPSLHFPSCHAATVVETRAGQLLAAWFAGAHEGHANVAIWASRFDGRSWCAPFLLVDEPGVPLWNPVLYHDARGVVWLFYKSGPAVPAWSGLYMQSADGGAAWSEPIMLPAGLLGPAKNKPITLSNGDIICGTSAESWRNWAAWVEISATGGRSWTKHGPIAAPVIMTPSAGGGDSLISAFWDVQARQLLLPQEFAGVIQPTLWESAPGVVHMLLRSTKRVGAVCSATSNDYGRTWNPARPLAVPNPNSGLDAVRLADGRIVLACNPTAEGRSPLALLISHNNGETWPGRLDLETGPGEFSYPSLIQSADGSIHVVYTHRRRHIQHVSIEPHELDRLS